VASLQLNGVRKSFGATPVLDDVSLAVEAREFIAFLGPSGSGKSTLLRIIAGLESADAGEVWLEGRRIDPLPPGERGVAMVFQHYALYPHMSVRENMAFGLRNARVARDEIERRIGDAARVLEIEALLERKPAQLSGGQQQRVALARAVVTRPDILLFDEPLSNLDAKLRERLRIEIRELQRRLGITSVYVTHDQAEALVISDRIVVMNKGRIEQMGDPLMVYRRPTTSFTAEFIGQANILKATVVSTDPDGSRLDTAIGPLASSAQPEAGANEVIISWRPEDMIPFQDGMPNRIAATVSRVIFMGNLTDIAVEANGTAMRVERPGSVDWQVGDVIELGVPADRIQILR